MVLAMPVAMCSGPVSANTRRTTSSSGSGSGSAVAAVVAGAGRYWWWYGAAAAALATGAGCDTLMNWVPCVAPPLEPPPAFTACDPTPPVPPRNRSGGTDADCWRGRAAWPLWTDARPAWRS